MQTRHVQDAGRTAHDACQHLVVMTDLRTQIEVEAQQKMQQIFDGYDFGIEIVTVKLQNIVPPEGAVQDAFEDVFQIRLCVVGDVEPEDVCRIADEVLGSIPGPAGEKLRPWQEDMTAAEPEIAVSMEVAMPMFNLAFKCESLGKGEKAIRTEMVADLAAEALFGESSELYLRLYEQGLIDSSFGGGFETIDGCAMLLCSGDSQDPRAVREAILAQGRVLSEQGVPEETFQRMKRSALGRRIRSLDSFDATCFRVCAYHFSDFDYFRFPEVYRSITAGEIRDFLDRVIRPERCSLSVVYPLENEGGNES